MAHRSKCKVRGCESQADEIFNLSHDAPEAPPWETLLCDFHHRHLSLGAVWTLDPESNELIVDDPDAPLDVVSFQIRVTTGAPVVTLRLGHDGVETQQVRIRIPAETVRQICHIVGPGEHPDAYLPPSKG